MNYKKIFILILLTVISINNNCFSEPLVSKVTTLEIKGTSFGSGSAPLIWENFENGINNQKLDTVDPTWVRLYGDTNYGSIYSNSQKYSGNFSASNTVSRISGVVSGQEFGTSYKHFTPTDYVYCSYRAYHTHSGTVSNLAQWKMTRITSNYAGPLAFNPDYNGAGRLASNSFPIADQAHVQANSGFANDADDIEEYYTTLQENKWYLIEIFYSLGSSGSIYYYVNGVLSVSYEGITRQPGFTFQEYGITLGTMLANYYDGSHDFVASSYIDDVYINNTQARVMIGNNPIFSNCTHREIQIPTSWSDTEISITYNNGSFVPGDRGYLFVIDADGNASAGYDLGTLQSDGTWGNLKPVQATNLTMSNVTIGT